MRSHATVGITLWLLVASAGVLRAEPPCPSAALPAGHSLKSLVRLDRCELESLYRAAEVGTPPCGVTSGRAIFNPGGRFAPAAAQVTRLLWQGKVFQDDVMTNRVFGLRAVKARVYCGSSWLDGKPSLVMDYCGMSRLFPNVRDEMREIEPGLYIGLTYLRRDDGPRLATYFAIDARR
jgi:hypothetical protein